MGLASNILETRSSGARSPVQESSLLSVPPLPPPSSSSAFNSRTAQAESKK